MPGAVVRGMVFAGCVASMLAGASIGRAQEAGVEIGFRTGYALPMGSATDQGSDPDMDNLVSGNVPLWFDLGVRATPNVLVGAYFQYGIGFPGDLIEDGCDMDGVDCSIPVVRLGAQFHYHVQPFQPVDPWVGLGLGYEWLTWSVEAAGEDGSFTLSGFEFVNLQAGVDFGLGDERRFGIGPFVAFSVAEYSSVSCDGAIGLDCDDDIEDKALHHWLTLGLRGVFVP
jgi:hypothetical protein